jgi:DNA-binding CsgD family transcriptional regulator
VYRIILGSSDWWRWLADQSVTTFRFEAGDGNFTARRELKHGGWYWYAYRKRSGKLHKAYLGKSEALSPARLDTVATALSQQAIAGNAVTTHVTISAPAGTSASTPAPAPAGTRADALLATKLYIPAAQPIVLARVGLASRVNAERVSMHMLPIRSIGSVEADRLINSAQRSAWPMACDELDEQQGDRARLWNYLRTALGPDVLTLLRSLEPTALARLVSLVNAHFALPRTLAHKLGENYTLTVHPIRRAHTSPLDQLPPELHLLIPSRMDGLYPDPHEPRKIEFKQLDGFEQTTARDLAALLLTRALGLNLCPLDIQSHSVVAERFATPESAITSEQIARSSAPLTRESPEAVEPLAEPLSQRELEILYLIAAGLSNQEIAQALVVGAGTIKWHINNIYGKLGVHSRTQAVARARDLRLLS